MHCPILARASACAASRPKMFWLFETRFMAVMAGDSDRSFCPVRSPCAVVGLSFGDGFGLPVAPCTRDAVGDVVGLSFGVGFDAAVDAVGLSFGDGFDAAPKHLAQTSSSHLRHNHRYTPPSECLSHLLQINPEAYPPGVALLQAMGWPVLHRGPRDIGDVVGLSCDDSVPCRPDFVF